jgi:hypothetical protein
MCIHRLNNLKALGSNPTPPRNQRYLHPRGITSRVFVFLLHDQIQDLRYLSLLIGGQPALRELFFT